jgi:hypothetical protein
VNTLLADRFRAKVSIPEGDGCWEWTGTKTSGGYGQIKANGHRLYAHRVALIVAGVALSDRDVVCHSCDRPSCVNPAHLFVGTQKDNMGDCSAKGRTGARRGIGRFCRAGHEMTEANTSLVKRGGKYGERCRTCHNEHARQRAQEDGK